MTNEFAFEIIEAGAKALALSEQDRTEFAWDNEYSEDEKAPFRKTALTVLQASYHMAMQKILMTETLGDAVEIAEMALIEKQPSGKTMTKDEIYKILIELRYGRRSSNQTYAHFTRVRVGDCGDGTWIISPTDDSQLNRVMIRQTLLNVFGDIDNVRIGKSTGSFFAV